MIELKNLSFGFKDLSLFSDLSYSFEKGKFYSIVGPSGCGKTTLLNLISGLLPPIDGNIVFSETGVLKSYMMQTDALLPWRTVEENIRLVFEILKRETKEETIKSYLKTFELADFAGYYPNNLSAGMKQRVALIQSLIPNPDILLMDEPFSNLDFDIKLKIQKNIVEYLENKNTTTIMVTHDIEDAVVLSDYIIVLTEKPVSIKNVFSIEFPDEEKNPIELRKSHKLRDYFVEIWDELKYLK